MAALGGQRIELPSVRPPLAASERAPEAAAPTLRTTHAVGMPPVAAPIARKGGLRPASITLGGPNVTGQNPWWTFDQGTVPGLGSFMVNVGSSKNLVVESEDFRVPHRWVDLAFKRTYNSMSRHDYAGSDGSQPSSFGNGWTNTLDAHLAVNSGQNGYFGISVYDADGARYDYLPADGTGANFVAPPGQHATLTVDATRCNYYYTTPGGTSYQFHTPVTDRTKPCGVTPRFAAIAGRLITIYGRNQRSQIGLSYTYDGGVASSAAALVSIGVTLDGVQNASTLTFANSGANCVPAQAFRLLRSITRPDNSAIYYKYDCAGNLVEVDEPGNQIVGAQCLIDGTYCRVERYAYNASHFMTAASGPVWSASLTDPTNLATGTKGGYVVFNPAGSTNGVASVQFVGRMNYTISEDGYSNTPFNSTGGAGVTTYQTRYFDAGSLSTAFHDTDGHRTTFTYDGSDRVTNTQSFTDTGSLSASQTWDADHNLVSKTDLRANRTDYRYDAYGNVVAVAQPAVGAYVNGAIVSLRPTKLYTYDAHNNVIAACDPVWSAANAANWDGVSSPRTCPTTPGSVASPGPQISAFADRTGAGYEPFGELTDVTSALGYHRHYTYSGSAEGGTSGNAGVDFGSVTTIAGDGVPQQLGAPTVTPTESYVYDANGNAICRNDGLGWAVAVFDSLGRKTQSSDADDSKLTQAACSKTPGIANSAIYSTVTYLPNGQAAFSQSPGELAVNTQTAYTYDLDGNELSETHHYGCAPGAACTPGTTQKWYDGADRLVEVSLPHDANDSVGTPWLTRYVYDLAQNGAVSIGSSSGYAHGNLFKTQEFVTAVSNPSPFWTDTTGNFFESMDRPVKTFHLSTSVSPVKTSTYDASGSAGLLSTVTDATNEVTTFAYDAIGRISNLSFSGSIPTAPQTRTYDPNGRPAQISQPLYEINANGGNAYIAAPAAQTYTYDAEGHLKTSSEPNYGSAGAVLNPTTLSYDYYADGRRKDLSVSSRALTTTNLIQYAYRPDGLLSNEAVNYGGQRAFSWSYSAAGRKQTQYDPLANQVIPTVARAQASPAPLASKGAPAATGASRNPFAPTIVGRPLDQAGLTGTGNAPVSKAASALARISTGHGSNGGKVVTRPPTREALAIAPTISTTYGPTSWSYDATGRLSSLTYPMGRSYTGLAYDPDNELTSYTGYGAMLFANSYDNRGELTGQHAFDPGTTTADLNWPHFAQKGFLGYMTPVNEGAAANVNTSYGFDVIDAQANFVQQNSTINNQIVNNMTWYSDGNDRQVQGTYQHLNSDQSVSNGAFNKIYDAQDHLVNFWIPANSFWIDGDYAIQCNDGNPPFSKFTSQTPNTVAQAPYIWGPNGHPMTMFGDGVHWDGDSVLFTTDENGNLDDIKVGDKADILPSGEIVMRDRDWTGALVMSHSAGGFGQWLPPNPNHDKCVPKSPPPSQPANYVEPGTTNPSTALGGYGLVVTQPGGDSVFDGLSYIQGVRNYNAQSGGWTTPDAAPGSADDPVSQKSFAYNDNNPVAFSDPSGFCPAVGSVDPSSGLKNIGCVTAHYHPPEIEDPELYAQFGDLYNFSSGLFFVMTVFVPGGEFGDVAEAAIAARVATKASSRTLARNLGGKVTGKAAHHIVAGAEKRAQDSRAILQSVGIGINDAENGIMLDIADHQSLHTEAYYIGVNDALEGLTTRDDVCAALSDIKSALQNGWRPR